MSLKVQVIGLLVLLSGKCPTRDLEVADLDRSDLERMAELVETYGDLPLGTTDASVIAVAERLKITRVLTLDRRDFSVVRPRHTTALELLP